MHLWILSNPDLTNALVAGQTARSEAMTRAGYLAITALERGLFYAGDVLAGQFRGMRARVARARQRGQAVAALRSLDDRLLADIGISRGEIVGLVEGALERGPGTSAELRDLPRPAPQAVPSEQATYQLPKAA